MAYEATHIRFALDLKDKYDVKNLQQFVAGTIYPDSRYMTKIDRELTHPDDLVVEDFSGSTDFKKGWYMHLICDKIQYDLTSEMLSHLFSDDKEIGQGSDFWVKRTALKLLQDMEDVKKLDVKTVLPYLYYIENPNAEDASKIKQYHSIFQGIYSNPQAITIDDYDSKWFKLVIDQDLAAKLRKQTEEYSQDPAVREFIEKIYQAMVAKMKEYQ